MGNCVGNKVPLIRQSDLEAFSSLVHQKQYYLLKLIYADLGSRIPENQVNLENFLLFFEKNGYWGNRLFKQFDVGASNLITQEQFIKGIVKIFKTTQKQKIKLLFKFFSGSVDRQHQGVGFTQFLTMLYNYPKEDFKKILNDQQFFNRELRKNLVADDSRFKGRRLDSICFSDVSYNDVKGTTFRMEENEVLSDRLESKIQSDILKELNRKKLGKRTTFKVKIGQSHVEVATTNIHHMVKKFAISIFKSYSINIRYGKLRFQQFQDWMAKHRQLFNDYYKGFRSQIWEINKRTLLPLFIEKQMEFQSQASIQIVDNDKKIVIISLLRSILIVRQQSNLAMPISIVCLDGLSAKKVFENSKGWGIQINHRDQIYEVKKFFLKNEQLADKWMESLKFYKGCSITSIYQMGDKIGVGKFSIVYKGIQNSTGDKYAIKVIESSKLEEQAKKLIAHESSIMTILSHPIIVSFKQTIQTKTNIYIVTELVEGKDMYEFVKDSSGLDQYQAAFIVRQIIVGVRYLHSLGIVHRDLKPENIMIQYNQVSKRVGKIKIIDFGFANYLQSLKALTPQQCLAGTPNYIAPQSLRLQKNIDEKIDNFAIGSILYFALSANLPFGKCKVKQILQNTLNGSYQINDKRWKAISKEAKDLVTKLLENDPSDRISLDQALIHPWFSNFTERFQQQFSILDSNNSQRKSGKN